MKLGFKELVSAANQAIKIYSVSEAQGLVDTDGVIFIDVRDEPELIKDGKIPGAIHASRGMLEFHIDPESPYHKEIFAMDKEFVFYCATGGRSALAAQRAQEMGLTAVAHVEGGMKGWKEAGGKVNSAKD